MKQNQVKTSYTLLYSFWNTDEGVKGKTVSVYAMKAYSGVGV